ncbi:MAG: sigma 54-interacting transcriptional regulator [Polyangiaceae bacterium]
MSLLTSSNDPEETVRAWEQAERDVSGWPFLLRDALVHSAVSRVVAGQRESAARTLRQLARALDAAPSPWLAAHQRRAEGTFRAACGEWVQARELLTAAIATFELAGDRVDAALTRTLLTTFGEFYGEPDATEQREQSETEVAALGLVVPAGLRVGLERLRREQQRQATAPDKGALERLVVAVRRLTVRGTSPHLIEKELVLVLRELLPGRSIRLEDVDSHGLSTLVGATAMVADPAPKRGTTYSEHSLSTPFEFGDGSGRRLRLVVRGPLDSEERQATAMVLDTAGLALEVAALRGLGGHGRALDNTSTEGPDIPGFVAVSASIRRLRAEIAGLGSSRATVVVLGESGSGKEVVARAIHDLSTRRAQPYVAFNCATVPRDLFEGQLFGYKRAHLRVP